MVNVYEKFYKYPLILIINKLHDAEVIYEDVINQTDSKLEKNHVKIVRKANAYPKTSKTKNIRFIK